MVKYTKKNRYEDMGIFLIGYDAQGNCFCIDKEDYDKIKEYYWCDVSGYMKTYIGNHRFMAMHRFLTGCPEGKVVDHINHIKTDNRRQNLRICEHWQNGFNQPLQKSNTSGYKGVDFHKRSGKWRARIKVRNKRIELGRFDTAEKAYEVYCQNAKFYHGHFASFG